MSTSFSKLVALNSAGALSLFLAAVGPAKADVIWDYSPDTTHAAVPQSAYSNDTSGQNFLELVNLTASVGINGMDVFSNAQYGSLGQSATVKIFSAAGGVPSSLLDSFTASIDAVDTVGTTTQTSLTRKHVDFAPVNLSAGSYWVGMSGTTTELAQATLANVQDNRVYQLTGSTFNGFAGIGDMAFRLFDVPSTPVPEPLSLALLGVGVLMVGAARCRASSPSVV